jgi:phosphatidylglycerophosphate synthase
MSMQAIASEPFRLSPAVAAVVVGVLLATLIYASAAIVPVGEWFALEAAASYVVAAALVVSLASAKLASRSFGLANTVTLTRTMLTAFLAGLVLEPPTVGVLWLAVVVATVALILDGVDGKLARRYGETSGFGARFDMETDAALMLVLAVLVWQLDRAGLWIVLAGALRYLFVGAGCVVAKLRRPLPPSLRRKTACIVQLVALVVALGPIIPPTLAELAAGAGLAVLGYSFACDVARLLLSDR